MKFIKNILSIAVIMLLAASCSNLSKNYIADENNRTAPVIEQPSAIIIDEITKSEEVTFAWKPADFGIPTTINYQLYVTYGSGNPVLVGSSNQNSYKILKSDLNFILCGPEGAGAPENETSEISMYLTASIGTGEIQVKSKAVTFAVSTMEAVTIKKTLWIPGSYQGWNPGAAPTLSETDTKGIFEGFVGLFSDKDTVVQFKFTSQPNWDGPNYGSKLGKDELISGGKMTFNTDGGAENHFAKCGIYRFYEIDTKNLTGKYEAFKSISVVGAFNGWNGNKGVEMKYDIATNSFSALVDFTGTEGFLILLNGDFGNKFARATDDVKFRNGNDFMAPAAGKYKVTLSFKKYPATLTMEVQ